MPKNAGRKLLERPGVLSLVRAIVRDDAPEVAKLLGMSPFLARECLVVGATREATADFSFEEINHYLYAGDTPLHAAAAAYRIDIAPALIKHGADIAARNRRGAEPLHYAADGLPGSSTWNPQAQAEMITLLISAGANPNALAVQNTGRGGTGSPESKNRQREIIGMLLKAGADPRDKDGRGKTARQCTQSDWIHALL